MTELIISNDTIYSKIVIDGDRYLVYYKNSGNVAAEFNRKYCDGTFFHQYAKLVERKEKLAKLLQ